jgi:hypothetical protein
MKDIAADLNKAGYVTYIPLVVGMGLSYSYQCSTPNVCVGKHPDNVSEMPTTKEGYMNWAKSSLGWITADVARIPSTSRAPGFSWTAMGLSLGGPMSLYAAQLPGNPFSQVLTINPFFGISLGPVDFEVYFCQTQPNPQTCIQNVVNNALASAAAEKGLGVQAMAALSTVNSENALGTDLVSNRYDVFMRGVLNITTVVGDSPSILSTAPFATPVGWGDSCIAQKARPGYCDFRVKNLLAMQAFVSYVVGNLNKVTAARHASITSDYDGPTRDSIANAVNSRMIALGKRSSRCRYRLKCSITQYNALSKELKLDVNYNGCGVPHACCSRVENSVNMYWESDMFAKIRAFVGGASAIGSPVTATDPSQCVVATGTMNYNAQFDAIGPAYLTDCQNRFAGK